MAQLVFRTKAGKGYAQLPPCYEKSMDSIALNGKCPICGQGPLRALPLEYRVTATKGEYNQHVGGLLAYQCTQEGHIFFVRAKDVEESVA